MPPRLRKKCSDCGKRGNWPKATVDDPCPECMAVRRGHEAIRQGFIERCTGGGNVPRGTCHPTRPPVCPSCTEYFASETCRFFLKLP
jgi:hypothetical protein